MDVEELTFDASQRALITTLGMDADALDCGAPEVIAESLRRCAAVRCPCRRQALTSAVMQAVKATAFDTDTLREQLNDMVDTLVAHGDLVEIRGAAGEPDSIHLAPLAYVRRRSGVLLLLGGAPDVGLPIPTDLSHRIERAAHVRRLSSGDPSDAATLRDAGFIEITVGDWARAPKPTTSRQLVERITAQLDRSGPGGQISDLQFLDGTRSPRYYKGRWADVRRQTGVFVARRTAQYGNRQWCVVRLEEGAVLRFLLLPANGGTERGCDAAWRIQAAIDSTAGTPQEFRMRSDERRAATLELFSPVPNYAQRRWDAVGERLLDRPGCLLAYRIPIGEIDEERRFLQNELWMTEDQS